MLDEIIDRGINPLLTSLPDKFETIYDWQVNAIVDIVEGFREGRLVVLEAPTGTGKTLIAEVVRRLLRTRGVYVCHNKELQDQFARDFPYSRAVYGRANYIPSKGVGVTCEDCTWKKDTNTCAWCPSRDACPYIKAKEAAIHSPSPVLNSAYWLNEVSGERSRFKHTGLVTLDEADTLEGVLMGQVEVYIGERAQKKYGITPPKLMTKGFVEWGERTLIQLEKRLGELSGADYLDLAEARELRRVNNLHAGVSQLLSDTRLGVPWVYTGGAGSNRRRGDTISFRPVTVDRHAEQRVWSRDKRFLLMAALVPEVTVQSLGWTEAYTRVTVESQFPVVNRQVVVRPVANVTRKGYDDGESRRLGDAVKLVLNTHAGERVLIHSVSYKLRDSVYAGLQGSGRRLFTYTTSADRSRAIQEFKATPASCLIAPGLERGIDLPDSLCRAQVIVKVPFPNLGDKQVAERLYNTPNGKVWYNQQVATSILQMVGRGVRHREDYCTTYILDATFIGWYRQWGHLLPSWFRKGVRVEHSYRVAG